MSAFQLEEPPAVRIPAPPGLVTRAEQAVKDFHGCFWFWHPDAQVRYLDDIELVIRHLREYGGWKAWRTAQDLRKCL
jgi:hypothetical protein